MALTLKMALADMGRTDPVLDHKVYEDRVVIVFVKGDKQIWRPTSTPQPSSDAPTLPDEAMPDMPPILTPIVEEQLEKPRPRRRRV